MYYLDPKRGERRRRRFSKQFTEAGHNFQSGINKTGRDIRKLTNNINLNGNHKLGTFPHTWPSPSAWTSLFGSRAYDQALAKRMRASLGRFNRRSSLRAFARQYRRYTRNQWLTLWGTGFGTTIVGAGLMYFFDAKQGRQRRSRLSDKFVHAGHSIQSSFGKTGRDIRNRTIGAWSSIRRLFGYKGGNDEVLAQRVRSQLGRFVTHPGSIQVVAQDGRVTLSGPVLAQEVGPLIWHVYTVRGVKEVQSQLDVHEEAGRIPGLQGEGTPRSSSGFRQTNWSPAVRVIAGTIGTIAFISGARSRGPIRNRWGWGGTAVGTATAIAGSLLTTRAITNLEFSRLTGIGAQRSAIDVQKSIHINAPVEQVFAQWSNFENFPTFMSHVRQVRRLEEGPQGRRWHWIVDGPAGTKVEFDVNVTSFKTNRLIAWSTDRSSMIKHLGRVEFSNAGDGSTTVKVRMSYNPIAGALGHAVAKFFGADPKHQMDDDLLRLKSYLETGRQPHDAAALQAAGAQKSVKAKASTSSRP